MPTIAGRSVLTINIDAHLDVRPLKNNQVHSGSPFRLLLEDARFRAGGGEFVEFAAQGPQCAVEHVQFLRDHGGRVLWLEDMVLRCAVLCLYDAVTPVFTQFV